MKEFLSIGELAKIFDMDVQLLRHYDAKGLLVPQVRNSENSRRFYHFDQVYPLATIRYLRRLGYPLARIRDFLHNNALRDNLEMLSEQAEKLPPPMRRAERYHSSSKSGIHRPGQSSSQRGKFSVRTFPRRAFLHIGDEINLFTHELLLLSLPSAFTAVSAMVRRSALQVPMNEYRFPAELMEGSLLYSCGRVSLRLSLRTVSLDSGLH